MGYTHYFEQTQPTTPEEWALIVKDFARVLSAKPAEIGIATQGGQALEINASEIFFNGCDPTTLNADEGEDLSYEAFHLYRDGSDNTEDYRKRGGKRFPFSFCKTAQRPYDLIVCAALIIVNRHAPDNYDIGSDGTPDDWTPALELVTRVLGSGYSIPPRILSLDGYTEEFQKQYRAQHPELYATA